MNKEEQAGGSPSDDPPISSSPKVLKLFRSSGAGPRPSRLARLGFDVDSDGRVIDSAGVPSDSIRAVGPLRIGAEWESIAIPELRRQAARIAEQWVDPAMM